MVGVGWSIQKSQNVTYNHVKLIKKSIYPINIFKTIENSVYVHIYDRPDTNKYYETFVKYNRLFVFI